MAETPTRQTSPLAIAALVLGIIAATTSFLPIINNLSFFVAIAGAVLGLISLVGARRSNHQASPLGIVSVVLCVVSIALVLYTQSLYSQAVEEAFDSVTNGPEPVAGGAGDSETDWGHMQLGQVVVLENGLSIAVHSIERVPMPYDDGKTLVRAHVTYVNNNADGGDTISFNYLDWESEDMGGVQKSATFTIGYDDLLDSGKLVPGGSVTGAVYFEGDPIRIIYHPNIFQEKSLVGWDVA